MSTFLFRSLCRTILFLASLCSVTWVQAAVKEYHLDIAEKSINVTGRAVKKITVNGQFPAPLLEFYEGDDAVIHVHNSLKKQDSSIHWHGILLPGIMDGVPGFNGFNAIKPNGDFVYKFKVRQSGTYWYHAHSKGQEQDGLYGALVIYPKNHQSSTTFEKTDRDYVVMFSDFHESSSKHIQINLKKDAEYYQNQRQTVFDVLKQAKTTGLKETLQDRRMWNQMRMSKTDLSDVTGYTFLVNGKTTIQNWTGLFKPNERIRLRFINAAAMSFFDVRIPNLKMTVVSADGQAVQPVAVDEFRIGAAETYDVIVEPKADHYQIQAESIDRSGFALATLQNENQPIMQHAVQVPKHRPRALLTMEDMGHSVKDDSSKDHLEMSHSNIDHASMNQSIQPQQINHTAMANHSMDHASPNHQKMNHAEMNHLSMNLPVFGSETTSAQDHHAHLRQGTEQQNHLEKSVYGWANTSTPKGLKALKYADLKALKPQSDVRSPERELEIRLGGNMQRYIWTMNGEKFSDAKPLTVKYGERIRLKFINDSMMAHPMHLHGMFMQLENGQVASQMPNKHTLIVPPGKTVTALLTADELGEWAIHCHLLYHMSSGMMNKLIVAKVDDQNVEAPATSQMKQGGAHVHH
ncbi:copper resistance system multicopper oxidase [Acinetobacter shaoyimingii]|uniref:Copper resistance system multicopper oxidase n=1 Tax=Acinetobacter shaoyimingii TaxID=2715164 RepID=A0A6G8RT85_9GAMM|nr:copper resistance system multicopper oxidase [Acinetobacter shaoyimingii]QIO05179.1 copper resistance system multicopper oxidase [Acinetobacter shaoyimingii]